MAINKPIFICGTGRCGTSILMRLLEKHNNIFSLRYEGRFIVSDGGIISILKKDNDDETVTIFKEKILGEWYQKIYHKGTPKEYIGGLCTNVDKHDIELLISDLEKMLRLATKREQ